jgi:hypothetical protein
VPGTWGIEEVAMKRRAGFERRVDWSDNQESVSQTLSYVRGSNDPLFWTKEAQHDWKNLTISGGLGARVHDGKLYCFFTTADAGLRCVTVNLLRTVSGFQP